MDLSKNIKVVNFTEINSGFNLNSVTSDNSMLSKETIEKATKAVIKELTEAKGTKEDDIYSKLIASVTKDGDKDSKKTLKETIKNIINQKKLVKAHLADQLAKKIFEDNYGWGPIDDLSGRENINEIMVNGAENIFIEIGGKLYKLVDKQFESDEKVIDVIRRLLQYAGKDITLSGPKQEAKLADGSRLAVSIPPFAYRPYINIRKHDAFDVTADNFVNSRTLSDEMLKFFYRAIRSRMNIIIIGACGSGKTTLLKLLVEYYPETLRIVTIEKNFELFLQNLYPERNIVSYEEQPKLGITMTDCFTTTLVSRPDIIICGEARSVEADELIRSFRRGHPGSMSTIHTNSAETSIDDIAEMINEDGKRRDPVQLRHRVALAIDLIIQIGRIEETGERKVTRITEVVAGHEDFTYEWNDIFVYKEDMKEKTGDFQRVGNIKKKDTILKMYEYGLRSGLTMEDIKDLTEGYKD